MQDTYAVQTCGIPIPMATLQTSPQKRVVPACISTSSNKRKCVKSPPGPDSKETPVAPGSSYLQKPVLRLQAACPENAEHDLLFQFQNTPASEVRNIDSVEDLQELLAKETVRATSTAQNWVHQPYHNWIADIINELAPAKRARLAHKQRLLQSTQKKDREPVTRWVGTAEFASLAISLWFDGKTLEEVLDRSRNLGHLDEEMGPGFILEGSFIDKIAAAKNVDFPELLPMIQKLSKPGQVSVYKVRDRNCFEQDQRHSLPFWELSPAEGQGSLNTTWNYDEKGPSNVDMLDDFHASVEQATDSCNSVRLNHNMYLIWKFQQYVTSYHQDVHVPPHFTLYNQVSGVSLFHFLPLLVGLFVTHVGRQDVHKLFSVLHELDALGIGSIGYIGPGQVALILPFGSHGVWVPSVAHNPCLPKFEISLIRAAELFVQPLLKACTDQLSHEDWNKFLVLNEEDDSKVQDFITSQEALCRQMGLSKQDWLSLVQQTLDVWQQQAAALESDDDESDIPSSNGLPE